MVLLVKVGQQQSFAILTKAYTHEPPSN